MPVINSRFILPVKSNSLLPSSPAADATTRRQPPPTPGAPGRGGLPAGKLRKGGEPSLRALPPCAVLRSTHGSRVDSPIAQPQRSGPGQTFPLRILSILIELCFSFSLLSASPWEWVPFGVGDGTLLCHLEGQLCALHLSWLGLSGRGWWRWRWEVRWSSAPQLMSSCCHSLQ